MSEKKTSMSAQVNMLQKMREAHKETSILDNLLSNAEKEKKQSKENSHSSTQTINLEKEMDFAIINIPPSKCRPWKYADRDQDEMGNIEELASSIRTNGQQEPALLRKLDKNSEGDIEYEVIFGHRRWLACKLCDTPLMAMVKDIDDKTAAVAQKEENENRQSLSDYARAFNYRKLLDSGVFSSNRELAAYIRVPTSSLTELFSYTKLPESLLEAFITPHLLPKRSAIKLAQLCRDISSKDLSNLCSLAPLILSGKIPYSKLDIRLIKSSMSTTEIPENKPIKNTYKNSLNVKLFTSGLNQNKVPSLTFHKIVIDNDLLPKVESLIYDFLKEQTDKTDVN